MQTLIRKSIKKVLGVPVNASTEHLLRLGVHNTLDEIIEAQETAQISRLSSTHLGGEIIAVLGVGPTVVEERKGAISVHLRDNIMVAPFAKNVQSPHNAGRRGARAVARLRQMKDSPHTISLVDAVQ